MMVTPLLDTFSHSLSCNFGVLHFLPSDTDTDTEDKKIKQSRSRLHCYIVRSSSIIIITNNNRM